MMNPSLVILAAGVGRRYGGLKQLEPVGPGGETILDYAIYDARRAGFSEAILVVSPELEASFSSTIGRRTAGKFPVRFVPQRLDDLPAGFPVPAGRQKPWGTGQAVLALRDLVTGPFAVINADDFYGAEAYSILADFFAAETPARATAAPPTFAMVGYRLGDTLSASGSVSRALCLCDADDHLTGIEEILTIEKHSDGGRYVDGEDQQHLLPGSHLVSMNFWGFTPAVFPLLAEEFVRFLKNEGSRDKSEFYVPHTMRTAVMEQRALVKVLSGAGRWFGITYAQDRPAVVQALGELITRGKYPQELWA